MNDLQRWCFYQLSTMNTNIWVTLLWRLRCSTVPLLTFCAICIC